MSKVAFCSVLLVDRLCVVVFCFTAVLCMPSCHLSSFGGLRLLPFFIVALLFMSSPFLLRYCAI